MTETNVAGLPEASAPTSSPGAPTIRISGLRKRFTRGKRVVEALGGVDLEVARGEFVCVVGPSGCGKTTLLNIIAGLEQATSGSWKLDLPASSEPEVSVVFQEQGVFPWMTVLDNASFGLAVRGVSKRERHAVARETLAAMGLSRFEHSYPRELSGGMRQRVNLARAFATDPRILLMDEPFASLDEQTKLILQDDLLRVWEGSKKTVFFITHSLDEAIRLADRVYVMTSRPGRIKAVVPVMLPRPRHVFELASNPEYLRLHGEVWGHLRDEVLAAHAAEGRDIASARGPVADADSTPIGPGNDER